MEAFDEWFGEAGPGLCATGQANVTAVAHASAIAKVWADAIVNVQCEGQGFSCGWVYANANAWAIAFAEALATAAAETVSIDTGSGSFCYADVVALSSAFAEAATTVKGDTCTYRGDMNPVQFYQESFASAIQFAISEAYARAVSRTCDCKCNTCTAISKVLCLVQACSWVITENCVNQKLLANIYIFFSMI